MIFLNVNNLNVSIEGKKILNDFNITINEGEVHAIMGPNGCGKSTLAKALAKELNYVYADSGAMYRVVTLHCIEAGLFENSEEPDSRLIIRELPSIKISSGKYGMHMRSAEIFIRFQLSSGRNTRASFLSLLYALRPSKIDCP